MFTPEMMRAAQDMMSKMSPEELAEVQKQAMNATPEQRQQAMNMAQNMTPEQMADMQRMAGNMPAGAAPRPQPPSQATQPTMSAQVKYQYDASMMLKNEGNKLHGAAKFTEAAEKYNRAISNLSSHTHPDSLALLTTCRGNVASCYLQLERWSDCVDQCDKVVATEHNNRKALYRRGQALTALGRYDKAVRDLEKALQLSPANEKDVIKEKLDGARAKQLQSAPGGVVIEEVVDDDDDGPPELEDLPLAEHEELEHVAKEQAAKKATPASASVPAPPSTAATMPAHVQEAMAAMQRDPSMVKQAMEAVSSMSESELAMNMARAGGQLPPGFSPEMAKAAADMMKGMSEDEIRDMTEKAAAVASTNGGIPPTSMPGGAGGVPPAAAQQMMKDPQAIKAAAEMMKNMNEEYLNRMAASMPGMAPGMKIDAHQMKMAAKMMESMTPEDLERMSKMAETMQQPGGGPAQMDEASKAKMMQNMADPAMLKSMQNMMKNLDDDTLVEAMRSSGLNLTKEQARKTVDAMGSVSDKHLEIIAKIVAFLQAVYAMYLRVKSVVLGNSGMQYALIVLVIALILRWLGWL